MLRLYHEICILRYLLVGQVCRLYLNLLAWGVVLRSSNALPFYILLGAIIVVLVIHSILNRWSPAIFTSIRGMAFELCQTLLDFVCFFGIVFAEATWNISSFVDPTRRLLAVYRTWLMFLPKYELSGLFRQNFSWKRTRSFCVNYLGWLAEIAALSKSSSIQILIPFDDN